MVGISKNDSKLGLKYLLTIYVFKINFLYKYIDSQIVHSIIFYPADQTLQSLIRPKLNNMEHMKEKQ